MTNKQAIDILWQYDVNFEPHTAEEVMHAIDMAIEALKSVTINADSNAIKVTNCNDKDTIYRQDAIDALGEEPPVWYDGIDEISEREQWRRDRAAIESVPSAQPDVIPLEWIAKHLEWLDNCDNDFAQLAKVGIRAMVEIWGKEKTLSADKRR